MGSINSGDQNKRIEIQRFTTVGKDGHGNAVRAWARLTGAWAKVIYVGGIDRRQAAQDNAAEVATFRVRRTSRTATVTPADRIVFRGTYWEINGVAERNLDDVELTATAIKAGGLAA